VRVFRENLEHDWAVILSVTIFVECNFGEALDIQLLSCDRITFVLIVEGMEAEEVKDVSVLVRIGILKGLE